MYINSPPVTVTNKRTYEILSMAWHIRVLHLQENPAQYTDSVLPDSSEGPQLGSACHSQRQTSNIHTKNTNTLPLHGTRYRFCFQFHHCHCRHIIKSTRDSLYRS